MPKRLLDVGRETAAADVEAANKRGRAAGIAAVRAATQRGLTIVNHGAGTMPVGAPAPHGGERYSLLEDHEHAQQPYTVAAHDGTKGADGNLSVSKMQAPFVVSLRRTAPSVKKIIN